MDSIINTVASSEMIPTSFVAANPSNLPPNAHQKGPMPPSFPTSANFNCFAHSFNSGYPLVYTFAPPKAPMATHHAPPVYTYVTAPPITKAQEFHRQDVNHYVVIENDTKSTDAEMMSRKMKILEDAMRGLRGFYSSQSVRYEELCTFPEVELPPVTRFQIDWHWKQRRDKNQAIQSKSDWKSLGMVLKISITKLNPKSTECFREYAIRWREEVARVHPPMEESEMVTYFIQAQDSEYYERMVTMGGNTFVEVIKAGEMIEDGLKTSRITSYTSSQFANMAY
ncbi:hypothetical protein H5410_050764 [Solanum commersonii]|uniref:Uncharacterized protein n=1 Tax=Solanum commersonii TaxID=4109 RepID=A0A9J5WWD7_SOLCO|nr:hypothetical protein H5410_050764 [Solanum commersonii]